MYSTKPNGKPYTDFPSIDKTQLIRFIGVKKLCLVESKFREDFSSSDEDEEETFQVNLLEYNEEENEDKYYLLEQ